MLEVAAWTGIGTYPAENGTRIVQILLEHFHMTFPRWKDLTPSEHLLFYQLSGHLRGINEALTFDVSDDQLESWVREHGSIAEGFRKEIIHGCRHLFDGAPEYWFVVEPKVSKGNAKDFYIDFPGRPRRFDVHCGFKISGEEQDSKFQQYIWKKTEKLGYGNPAFANELFPLRRRGRMSYMRRVFDEFWGAYTRKCLDFTIEKHADVTGIRPFGASSKIKGDAASFYRTFHEKVLHSQPAANEIIEKFRSDAAGKVRVSQVVHAATLAVTCGKPYIGTVRKVHSPTSPASSTSHPRLTCTP